MMNIVNWQEHAFAANELFYENAPNRLYQLTFGIKERFKCTLD